jgi:hypothetical protein
MEYALNVEHQYTGEITHGNAVMDLHLGAW